MNDLNLVSPATAKTQPMHHPASSPFFALRLLLACGLSLLLGFAGCAIFEPAAAPARAPLPELIEPVRAHYDRDALLQIRADAAALNSSLEVAPVESAGVALLLSLAREAENQLDFPRAQSLLTEALKEEPLNPRIYQSQAELALKQRRYELAERLAHSAFERSGQVGELCARSWLTIGEARLGRALIDATAEARRRARSCAEHGIERF